MDCSFKKLSDYLSANSSFTNEELDLICSYFDKLNLKKDESVFKKGERFRKLVFVADGILRSFIHDDNGDEKLKLFIQKNEFFSEIDSFEDGMLCSFNVSTVTDCELLVLSKTDCDKLSEVIPKWDIALRDETVKAMNRMIKKQEFLNLGESKEKYYKFMKRFPDLALNVPLKYIASYLNITQSSLSRIRRQL